MLTLARSLFAIASLAILVAAAYFLWSWSEGAAFVDERGAVVRVRENWRLWTGGALLAWSLAGRFIVPRLLARGGDRAVPFGRGAGSIVDGRSGSSLYVEQAGLSGAPVIVFTHGWGMDSTFWRDAREDLVSSHRLVLWDLPGLGRSKAAPGGISLEVFADELRGILESLDRPAVLVGHSIGGMTIQTLVRDHPEAMNKVAGVVLLHTTYTNPLRTMVGADLWRVLQKPVIEPMLHLTIWLSPLVWLSKWQSYLSGSAHLALRFGFGKAVTRAQLEHATLLMTRANPAVEAKGNLAMLNWDATGAISTCAKPVLVIGGDIDIVTKLEASETIAHERGDTVLQVAEGANHLGPMERAETYNSAIAKFALFAARAKPQAEVVAVV